MRYRFSWTQRGNKQARGADLCIASATIKNGIKVSSWPEFFGVQVMHGSPLFDEVVSDCSSGRHHSEPELKISYGNEKVGLEMLCVLFLKSKSNAKSFMLK